MGQWREVGCLTAEVDTVVSNTPNHNSEEEDSHNVTEVTPGIIELLMTLNDLDHLGSDQGLSKDKIKGVITKGSQKLRMRRYRG